MHKWHFTPIPQEELERLRRDCDIPDMPTQMTYHLRSAISDRGDYQYQWKDKPHRLIYDACREIERLTAINKQLSAEMLRVIACFTDTENTTTGEQVDHLNRAMAAVSTALEGTTQPANIVQLLPGETVGEALVRYRIISQMELESEDEAIRIPLGTHIVGPGELRQTKL